MPLISDYTMLRSGETGIHTHPHAHIILPIQKAFYIRFLNCAHELTPVQIGFIPPGVTHDFNCEGLALALNIPAEMVDPVYSVLLTENWVVDIDEDLELLVDLIKRETRSEKRNQESLCYLFYYLYNCLVESHQMSPLSLRYLHANYAGPVSIAELADIEGYSTAHYSQWFKMRMGCTPSQYLQALRIKKAKEILATTRYRVQDVALQVGYINGSSLNRAFRSVVGVTPKEYRRRSRTELKFVAEWVVRPRDARADNRNDRSARVLQARQTA